MAEMVEFNFINSTKMLKSYHKKKAEQILANEIKIDMYEDKLNSFMLKLSAKELSEEEMQEFDGDIDEEIPVETDIDNNDDDELNDIEYMKYIDKDAFMILVEFLDDKLDVQ
jgi:Na+/phosphate symporter